MNNSTTTEQPITDGNDVRQEENNRKYWVLFLDKACSLPGEIIVEADSPEQAEAEAVKVLNEENDYGPEDDGGFIPILAFERSDLLNKITEMDNHRTGDR